MARSKVGPIVIGILTLGVAWAFYNIPAYASSVSDITQSTVKLYVGDRGNCSATFLQNSPEGAQFLSAAHCVGLGNLNMRKQVLNDDFEVVSEQVFYLKAVKTLSRKDVVILQTTDKNAKFDYPKIDIATLDEAKGLRTGQELLASGFPSADVLAITKGEFTARVPVPAGLKSILDEPMYQTTVPVAGGNSGGGLYARFPVKNGELTEMVWKLIGTTTAKRQDNDIMTYFQTTESVHDAIRGYVTVKSEKDGVDTAIDAIRKTFKDETGWRIDER